MSEKIEKESKENGTPKTPKAPKANGNGAAEAGLPPVKDCYFTPPKAEAAKANVKTFAEYQAMHQRALEDPEGFWGDRSKKLLTWSKPWNKTLEWNFTDDPSVEWFKGGKLNASYNCLDRHITGPRRNKVALIWQGEPEDDYKIWTYQMLYDRVCRVASALKRMGVKKGDRVVLYLPMLPETVVAMLACARIGAIHVLVFAGFSASSVQARIQDSEARIVITADALFRGGKIIPLKSTLDEALKDCPSVRRVIVVNRANTSTTMRERRDVWWRDVMSANSFEDARLPAVDMESNDTLFILYTSGSTGKPKGVMHSTGGYLTYAAHTMQYVFDLKDEDVHWCTADVGWVTGHTYGVYGPLLLGGTTVIFEGGPRWPDPDRFWQIIEKFRVNTFYTAPTAIRTLVREGEEWLENCDLSSIRLLGSVGEPIGADTWKWYHEHIGGSKRPIVDTWWQTETGGILISPLPFVTPLKPGSATLPLPGIDAKILRPDGTECKTDEEGYLVIKQPWPGLMQGLYKDPAKYKSMYFEQFPGYYVSGDGARKDKDGYFWLAGRLDDVINVSGHRFSSAEMEASFTGHHSVAEVVVVGMPHAVKGEAIYAFLQLKAGVKQTDELRNELRRWMRNEIGPIATPEHIQFVEGLPKTRSGKTMRRVLRKIVSNSDDYGDLTTLERPEVIEPIIKEFRRLTGTRAPE